MPKDTKTEPTAAELAEADRILRSAIEEQYAIGHGPIPIPYDILISLRSAARADLRAEQCTIIRPRTLLGLIDEVMALRKLRDEVRNELRLARTFEDVQKTIDLIDGAT